MSEQTIDLKKRRFLTQATGVVGAVGVGFVAWPFLSTWKPSAKTKAAGAPVDVDISKLESGQLVRVLWRKKPVWVFKRDESALDALTSEELMSKLADPKWNWKLKKSTAKICVFKFSLNREQRRGCCDSWCLYTPWLLSYI